MMRRALLVLLLSAGPVLAAPALPGLPSPTMVPAIPAKPAKAEKPGLSFALDGVPVAQVLRVVFGEVVKGSYVLDPAVVADSRQVSFRWDSQKGEIRPFLVSFLDLLGYSMQSRGGVDFVKPKEEKKDPEPDKDAFVYRPKYRDGSYLVDLLGPLFKGSFTVRRQVQAPEGAKADQKAVPQGSAAALIERRADLLVFNGTEAEIGKLQKVLAQVDIAGGQVLVRGALYEVQTGKFEGSAFQLAASLLSGKFGVTLGAGGQAFGNSLSFKQTGSMTIDAVLSALNTDSRFKVVSSPSLRVRDGGTAKLTVGQDVPVLGALSYPQGAGQAVQSVEYRSSGVIFNLSPQIREAAVDLNVTQQVSNFVKTDTGVNGSPTLTKRELSTAVTVEDGDVIVLGGLNEDKETAADSGFSFLPRFLNSHSSDTSKSEILLILQVTRI